MLVIFSINKQSDYKIASKLVTGQHFEFTFFKTFKLMKGLTSITCMF